MAKYFLTNKAVEDLSKIWDYTYEAWSENQAGKYYNMLIDCCKELAAHPEKGKNYLEINADIFAFKVGKHLIFYKVVKANQIKIIRILHEKMDLKSRIQE